VRELVCQQAQEQRQQELQELVRELAQVREPEPRRVRQLR